MEIALGMVRVGSRTSSPIVAIRAYPANAKNSNPADCSTPYTDAIGQPPTLTCDGLASATPTTNAVSAISVHATRIRASTAVLVTPR
ncbi:Uncharacterised protein [Mycobacterium tuberculosis]|nr:Uncharacterised protein [Mycobacterium tuberculosis]